MDNQCCNTTAEAEPRRNKYAWVRLNFRCGTESPTDMVRIQTVLKEALDQLGIKQFDLNLDCNLSEYDLEEDTKRIQIERVEGAEKMKSLIKPIVEEILAKREDPKDIAE